MNKIIIAIILFLVLSMPAFGSDWKYLGKGLEGNPDYLDMDSIVRKNKTVKFWYKLKLNTPEKDKSGKYIVERLANYEINCSERTMKTLSLLEYFDDGSSESNNFKEVPTGIVPDSTGDLLFKVLCK